MPKKKPEGRRGRGDGTLVERSPGVWRLRVFVGLDPVTKRPRQASRTFRGTRTDALKALRTFAREVDAGEHKGTKATVSDLFKAWLVHLERVGRRPATLNSYRIVIKTHLEPIRARRLVTVSALAIGLGACGSATTSASSGSPSSTTSTVATTTTLGHTPTSAPPGAGGTVPSLSGHALDQAESTLLAGDIGYMAYGGGAFGILDAANWTVCSQKPAAGAHAIAVQLVVARTCS